MATKINSITRICASELRQLHSHKADTQTWPPNEVLLFGKITFKKSSVLQIQHHIILEKTKIPLFCISSTERGAGQLTRNKMGHLTQTVV